MYVHLHVHSQYSLLDGIGRCQQLVAAAAQAGMPALALTDHGVMYGAVEFYQLARQYNIKPLIGCEVYITAGSRTQRAQREQLHHLILLATDFTGYQNLLQLVSLAHLEGFYYKPRIDRELLQRYSQGLIGLSGCLAGEIPALILQGQLDHARQAAGIYHEILGRDNFYLELQDHGLPEQRQVNRSLLTLARQLDLPVVATNDVHYLQPEDAAAQEVLLCIQTGATMESPDRLRLPNQQYYLKNQQQMAKLFGETPEALANTLLVADRCSVTLELEQPHLPDFPLPAGKGRDAYLSKLCHQGLARRYSRVPPAAEQRLDYELGIIRQMGYSGYFLIVWDLIRYAREQQIPVGPGRGSAAGSLVAYCLEITDVDPMAYGLLFERFLNPQRVTMPDIDLDLCFRRRGEVIDYVTNKYGTDHVAQIITFGTMAARASLRDVGRVLGYPYAHVDRVAKMVPAELGITLDQALASNIELKDLYQQEPWARQLVDTAAKLEGNPRHVSTHAAGVVIAPEPLVRFLPLQRTPDGAVVTQYPMQALEDLGLLKMDLLGLRNLTVIGDTVKLIPGQSFAQLSQLPRDDVETYRLLAQGQTIGVFQLESSGMRSLLRNLQPQRFEDIAALLALYRPGPLGSGMVEEFVQRKQGSVPVKYPHPSLQPILADTYGVILYQEQVMWIASELAGFSMAQADSLRQAMGKKKPEVLAALHQDFVAGAVQRGIDREQAEKIFELIAHFGGYGFNKSHSVAYALVAYWTAYYKTHHPLEFMAALLTSVADNQERLLLYSAESRKMGLPLLPPNLNRSQIDFTIDAGAILFGLGAVKNVGKAALEAILVARLHGEFASLWEFCLRVDLRTVNRRVLESLIKAGALDTWGCNRAQLLAYLPTCLEQASQYQHAKLTGQFTLWGDKIVQPPMPEVPEYPPIELLAMEKETLGIYLREHPAAVEQDYWRGVITHTLAELTHIPEGSEVIVAGLVTAIRRSSTRRDEPMAFLQLEDATGITEAIIFPRLYREIARDLSEDVLVLIMGRLSSGDENSKILVDRINLGEQRNQALSLQLSASADLNQLKRLQAILEQYPGLAPVVLQFPHLHQAVQVHHRYWVQPTAQLLAKIKSLLGADQVEIKHIG